MYKSGSWLDRNQRWVSPIFAGVIVMLSPPLLQSLSTPAQPFTIPEWVNYVSLFLGCLSLAVSGIYAPLIETRSAQVLCSVSVLTGYAVAILLFMRLIAS